MFGLSYEQIIEKIKKERGLNEEEIEERIEEKLKLLSDLISREGAAHIVANELGVRVFEDLKKKKFKIRDLIAGLNSVSILGKVLGIYDVREFSTEKRHGRVVSLLIGDETSVTRLVIWDENLITLVEKGSIKEGDILRVKNAYSRDNNGYVEVHLGNKSTLEINPEGEEIGDVEVREERVREIKDLREGMNAFIRGTIVQVFEPRFYTACPECNKRAVLEAETYKCVEHGDVKEIYLPVLNFFFDDGSDNIRVVCFRDNVKKLVGEDVSRFREDINAFDEVKDELLGKQFKLGGRVNKNVLFERIEFTANSIEELDSLDVASEMIEDLEK